MENVTLYAYLNINNPMVAWEVAIGRVRSACDLGLNHKDFGISLWQFNLLRKITEGDHQRWINELKLEAIRQQVSPHAVSRLRGMYFFENEEDANIAVDRWKIPQNKKFIAQVNFSATNLIRLDSEWITSYLRSDNTDWMPRYWKGETLGVRPLTEILASGIGIVKNRNLREKAYEKIIEHSPYASRLVSMAACAFNFAKIESAAQTIPGMLKTPDGIKLSLYIHMDDFSKNGKLIGETYMKCMAEEKAPPIIKPEDPDVLFHLPDNRHLEFTLTDKTVSTLHEEIHESIRAS